MGCDGGRKMRRLMADGAHDGISRRCWVIPTPWNPTIRRSPTLTKTGRGLIAARMIDAATILIVRRRRSFAVWADVCV
jgi:hypothetical protein